MEFNTLRGYQQRNLKPAEPFFASSEMKTTRLEAMEKGSPFVFLFPNKNADTFRSGSPSAAKHRLVAAPPSDETFLYQKRSESRATVSHTIHVWSVDVLREFGAQAARIPYCIHRYVCIRYASKV